MWKHSDSVTASNLNNNHSVLLGILFVLITFYLTATTLARNFEFYINEGIKTYETYWNAEEDITVIRAPLPNDDGQMNGELSDGNLMLDPNKLVCTDIELFAATWQQLDAEHTCDVVGDQAERQREMTPMQKSRPNVKRLIKNGNSSSNKNGKKINRKNLTNSSSNNKRNKRNGNSSGSGSGGGSGSGSGSGNGARNKSAKSSSSSVAKQNALRQKAQQQQQQQMKKSSSTAEPIIYLFALVFIYLLLKAASDINQHYKTQAKDGKRLRRCSLQSYASQTHKQDRRASKSIPYKNVPKL